MMIYFLVSAKYTCTGKIIVKIKSKKQEQQVWFGLNNNINI